MPTSSCPRASRAGCRTRARWWPSCTSSWAACGRAWGIAAAGRSTSCARARCSSRARAPARPSRTCTTCRSPRKRRTTTRARARRPCRRRGASTEQAFPVNHDKILILDFGSQVTQLIARRIRELNVYCEIHPYDDAEATLEAWAADGSLRGIILSGSHLSVNEAAGAKAPQRVFEAGVPVLGICYGMQVMAAQLGGAVEAGDVREFGYARVRARGHTRLLAGIEDARNEEGQGLLDVWMSHGDKVTKLPPGFRLMASTDNCPIAGMADDERGFYGLQWHPEVTHTKQGKAMLERF